MMKQNKKLIHRILAAVGGAAIIIAVALYINFQIGNPFSEAAAKGRVLDYIDQKYSGLGLYIRSSQYENGSYTAYIESSTNVDIRFTVVCHDEFKNFYDNYKDYVTSGLNTECRWSNEYSKSIVPVLKAGFPDLDMSASIEIDSSKTPALGAAFDPSLVKKASLDMMTYVDELSPEKAAEIITKVHNFSKEKGYYFSQYTLAFQQGVMNGGVSGITSEMIESGNLLTLLRQAKEDRMSLRDGPFYEPMRDSTKP